MNFNIKIINMKESFTGKVLISDDDTLLDLKAKNVKMTAK